MVRFLVFTALIATMTVAAMLVAGQQQTGKAIAASSSNCQSVLIEPDAAYGIEQKRTILVCR